MSNQNTPKRANRKSTKDDFVEALRDWRKKEDPETFFAIEAFALDLAKRIRHLNLKPEDYAPVGE